MAGSFGCELVMLLNIIEALSCPTVSLWCTLKLKLPISFDNIVVSVCFPCGHFGPHGRHVSNPPVKGLPFQHAKLDLHHVGPATVGMPGRFPLDWVADLNRIRK
jgi:hypothetical protein